MTKTGDKIRQAIKIAKGYQTDEGPSERQPTPYERSSQVAEKITSTGFAPASQHGESSSKMTKQAPMQSTNITNTYNLSGTKGIYTSFKHKIDTLKY